MWNSKCCFNLGVSHERYKPRLSDNFFEIGGTSINAVAVVSKINQIKTVSIEDFLRAQKIGDLIMNKTEANQINLNHEELVAKDIEVNHVQIIFIMKLFYLNVD